jgi:hypothetical protein
MFRDNEVVVQPVILDNQILISYIQKNLNGVVGSQYSNPYGQGRIQINSVKTASEAINYWASKSVNFLVEWRLFLGQQMSMKG